MVSDDEKKALRSQCKPIWVKGPLSLLTKGKKMTVTYTPVTIEREVAEPLVLNEGRGDCVICKMEDKA